MRLTREEIARVKESVKTGFFARKWWKSLSKEMKQCNLNKYEKSLVFSKLIQGLLIELSQLGLSDDELVQIVKDIDFNCLTYLHHGFVGANNG